MLRVLKKFQQLRRFSSAALPAPDTNPPILYTGVSKTPHVIVIYRRAIESYHGDSTMKILMIRNVAGVSAELY